MLSKCTDHPPRVNCKVGGTNWEMAAFLFETA
ncbi:hypothetical protein FHS27_005883 [Rhodopirellula rubra]|uniref:Uncharacterized protein n=1 Tax=Aporhodopirellula rubra TaxID=980271 RepID=A0A7W5H7W1_9BACT|nr:hypothetical protein [Aporhodopirellula rubra]